MKQIGGFFTYEPLLNAENRFWEKPELSGGDLKFFMSGRCANYYALEDILLTDTRRKAYVPVYTCETVLAPFIKAGYELLFYDVAKDLTPVFDEKVLETISVINLCGYYGFCSYDRDFIKKCSERGITIIEDTTHSIFSADGIDPYSDYVVGSLRKWIGVPAGGFAFKKKGAFTLPVRQPDKSHLSLRCSSMEEKQKLLSAGNGHPDSKAMEKLNGTFWDAEMMLRNIFDSYGSDEESEKILRRYDFEKLKKQRRSNYRYLLEHMPAHPQLTVIFLKLPEVTVPSHYTVYAKDRDMVQNYMSEHGIKTTAYWPKGPMVNTDGHGDADYIYKHILSFPCDQRYKDEDMEYICRQVKNMPE